MPSGRDLFSSPENLLFYLTGRTAQRSAYTYTLSFTSRETSRQEEGKTQNYHKSSPRSSTFTPSRPTIGFWAHTRNTRRRNRKRDRTEQQQQQETDKKDQTTRGAKKAPRSFDRSWPLTTTKTSTSTHAKKVRGRDEGD